MLTILVTPRIWDRVKSWIRCVIEWDQSFIWDHANTRMVTVIVWELFYSSNCGFHYINYYGNCWLTYHNCHIMWSINMITLKLLWIHKHTIFAFWLIILLHVYVASWLMASPLDSSRTLNLMVFHSPTTSLWGYTPVSGMLITGPQEVDWWR